jgi:hypothetical protein
MDIPVLIARRHGGVGGGWPAPAARRRRAGVARPSEVRLMRRLLLFAAVALAGCGPAAPPTPTSAGNNPAPNPNKDKDADTKTPAGQPGPAAVLTADEFVEQAKKYQGKTVTVKGKINRLFVWPDGKKAQIGLANAKGIDISCDTDHWRKDLAAEGDDVEVTGHVGGIEQAIIAVGQCEVVKRK